MDSEYDEHEDDYFLLTKIGEKQTAGYIRSLASDIWGYSCPNIGGGPSLTVQEAFTLAEDFVAEAKRRGY